MAVATVATLPGLTRTPSHEFFAGGAADVVDALHARGVVADA